jgi:CRISPR-associated protein Cas1
MIRYELITGFTVKIGVKDNNLCLKGTDGVRKVYSDIVIPPEKARFDMLISSAYHGYISIDAMNWLLSKKKSILFTDRNGNLVSELHPYMYHQRTSTIRRLQYLMSDDIKNYLARDLIETKLLRMLFVINSFEKEFKKDFLLQKQRIEREKAKINDKTTPKQLLRIEAEGNRSYWDVIRLCLPERWHFTARTRGLRGYTQPRHAKDLFNAVLNYCYAILASEITRACYATGFDPYYGFFHKERRKLKAFVYDVIEPFRFLVDYTIVINQDQLRNIGRTTFKIGGYVFPLFINPSAKNQMHFLLYRSLNHKIYYKGKFYPWTSIITLKLRELGSYLEGKNKEFTFGKPEL